MAGVFDLDLDQPEENVSDDELEEVRDPRVFSVRRAGVFRRPEARLISVNVMLAC